MSKSGKKDKKDPVQVPSSFPIPVKQQYVSLPLDQYVDKYLEELTGGMSPEVKRKFINDSKFFARFNHTVNVPQDSLKQKELQLAQKADKKIAYPNYDEYMHVAPPRDTDKWLKAIKDMYYRIHKGSERVQALDTVTAGWDGMEKNDFKNWLRYYEEKAHTKYSEASNKPIQIKVGQVGYWEDVNRAGYFVPIHKDPEPVGRSIDFAKDPATNEGMQQDDKREIIESQRNKIVSRLDSAEKLLRSQEGQIFAGKDFEALMHIIYELKKKIHTVNKLSVSTRLYEDMIVREANIQTKKGFRKAAELLFKIADGEALNAAIPPSPASGGGLPGSTTAPGPADPSPQNDTPPNPVPAPPGPGSAPSSPVAPSPLPKPADGINGFLKGLEGKDNIPTDELHVDEGEAEDNWVVEAQAAPPPAAPAQPDENLEVEERPEEQSKEDPDNATPATNTGKQSTFDQKADQLFQNLKIEDVVQKLEDTTKYYKTREMPRQLAWIDMMLDHLGLAPFFPALAEATNKALDSNQYILTRLEDITSRLRGTVQTNDIDLKGQNPVPSSPELDAARNKLQEDQDKENERKKIKKEQENAQVEQANKPEPELEVQEDLGGPVESPVAPPAPASPPAAPVR